MQKIVVGCLIALAIFSCAAAPVVSGDYDGLLIGVDREGTLTGYFESSTGAGQFSCVFFVSGKSSDPANRVDTWFPANRDPKEVIHGVLERSSQGETPAIRLKLEEEHGGCWNVQHFASDPSTFSLTERGN